MKVMFTSGEVPTPANMMHSLMTSTLWSMKKP